MTRLHLAITKKKKKKEKSWHRKIQYFSNRQITSLRHTDMEIPYAIRGNHSWESQLAYSQVAVTAVDSSSYQCYVDATRRYFEIHPVAVLPFCPAATNLTTSKMNLLRCLTAMTMVTAVVIAQDPRSDSKLHSPILRRGKCTQTKMSFPQSELPFKIVIFNYYSTKTHLWGE